jgi:hypothetical protein
VPAASSNSVMRTEVIKKSPVGPHWDNARNVVRRHSRDPLFVGRGYS